MQAGRNFEKAPTLDLPTLDLRQVVQEASRSLALLDAARLEELALACQKLNRDLAAAGPAASADYLRRSREAAGDLAVFARVLDATRANLDVMRRLRDLRQGRLEYNDPQRSVPETLHGND